MGVGGLDLVEGDDAEAGIVGVRRVGERDGERADGSGDEALATGVVADPVGERAALAGGGLVDVPGKLVEEWVFEDALVELGVFSAAVFARVVDEEFRLRDGGRAKGICFENVRAG